MGPEGNLKKYSNPLNRLLVLEFADGESHFLIKGSTIVSEKTTSRVDAGIEISDVTEAKTPKKQHVVKTLKLQEKDI